MVISRKLDGVGPIDNKPSLDYIHNFVKKYIYMCDT